MSNEDKVFNALADGSRRLPPRSLYAEKGQTLTDLCQGLAKVRQSASKHIRQLEDANLISVQRLHQRYGKRYMMKTPWLSTGETHLLMRRNMSAYRSGELVRDGSTCVFGSTKQ